MSLNWFIQRFDGWLIRIGPDAEQYGDKYHWCLPFSLNGKFEGVSTQPLTIAAVRTAIKAAESLGYANDGNLWERLPTMMHHDHKHASHHGDVHPDTGEVMDHAAAIANVEEYLAAMKAGKVHLLAVAAPLPVPGMPGVYAKTFLMKE